MKIYKIKHQIKLNRFAYWYLAFNSPFFIFRQVSSLLYYLYAACLGYILIHSLIKLSFHNGTSSYPFQLKFFALLLAILASAFLPNNRFAWTISHSASFVMISIIRLAKPQQEEYECFIKGYKTAIIIDFIWAIIQIPFMIKGIYINDYLYKIIGLNNMVGYSATIPNRITGLIWDPYVIGMYCATGFFLFDKKWIKAIILIILIGSQSRAGIIAIVIASLYYYYPTIIKHKNFLKSLLLVIIVFFLMLTRVDLGRGFEKTSSGYVRVEFFTLLPKVMTNNPNPLLFLFGGSPAATSARFSESGLSKYRVESFSESMLECDWAGIVYGQGFFGLIAYLSVFFYIFNRQNDRLKKTLAVAIFIGGIGYCYDHAIFTAMIVYLSTYNISKKNSENNLYLTN